MRAADAHRVEAAAGYAAAGLFAAAFGFAAFHVAGRFTDLRGMFAAALVSGLLACPVALLLLRLFEGQPKPYSQPYFETVEFEPIALRGDEELVLTDEDRLEPATSYDALVLDDALAEMSPDSRVVQLFDRSAMPTPAQLRARIDRHLAGGASNETTPDASEALFAALADLRRSLR